MSAAIALQKAVFAALSANPQLAGLTGPGKIFDDAPPGVRPPYLLLAGMESGDWSTGTESGAEFRFDIHIWSDQKGRKQAAQIADAARLAIEAASAVDATYVLINLRHLSTAFERDPQTEYHRAFLRFRAVVEFA